MSKEQYTAERVHPLVHMMEELSARYTEREGVKLVRALEVYNDGNRDKDLFRFIQRATSLGAAILEAMTLVSNTVQLGPIIYAGLLSERDAVNEQAYELEARGLI